MIFFPDLDLRLHVIFSLYFFGIFWVEHSETQDEVEGGMANLKKGFGGSSKKKKKVIVDFDSDRESNFMEDLVRDYKKKRGGKGKRIKGILDERAASPSDDEPLACRRERKRFPSRC